MLLLPCETITEEEQLKHLAFLSPGKVEQRLSNKGQALKSNSGYRASRQQEGCRETEDKLLTNVPPTLKRLT